MNRIYRCLSALASVTMAVCLFVMVFSVVAIAQDSYPIGNEDYIKLLIESLGGLKGASALTIAAIVVKFLLASLNSQLLGKQLDKLTGKMKLVVVSFLSLAAGVIALMQTGLSFGAALVHSSILPMFAVFVNQLYKQFIEKGDEPPKAQQ